MYTFCMISIDSQKVDDCLCLVPMNGDSLDLDTLKPSTNPLVSKVSTCVVSYALSSANPLIYLPLVVTSCGYIIQDVSPQFVTCVLQH